MIIPIPLSFVIEDIQPVGSFLIDLAGWVSIQLYDLAESLRLQLADLSSINSVTGAFNESSLSSTRA